MEVREPLLQVASLFPKHEFNSLVEHELKQIMGNDNTRTLVNVREYDDFFCTSTSTGCREDIPNSEPCQLHFFNLYNMIAADVFRTMYRILYATNR